MIYIEILIANFTPVCYNHLEVNPMSINYIYSRNELTFTHTIDATPNQEHFEMHAHSFYELYYFISGNGHYFIEGTEYPLQSGSLLLMRANETHKLTIESTTPYERISLHFPSSILLAIDPELKLLDAFNNRPIGTWNLYLPNELDCDVKTHLLGMVTQSKTEYRQRLAIVSRLGCLLYDINECFHKNRQHLPIEVANDTISQVIDFINANLMNAWNLSDLASQFFISKSYLNRKFKQVTGSTVWDYVLIKRLMIARETIRNGTPATLAFKSCGFNDYSTFYRQYKQRFGVSPNEDKINAMNAT